uniref:Thaumatin-like protein n=1 Tax=Globisporangium ultimum (strain ATCC 200006 / CBS 805.95 / DAOM BR144) TaxID=431595 RepID=K3XBA7_GLOUD
CLFSRLAPASLPNPTSASDPSTASSSTFAASMMALVLAAFTVALSTAAVDGAAVTFKNQCPHEIQVFDNIGLCELAPGSTNAPVTGCNRTILDVTMYRNGIDPQATQFAYTAPSARKPGEADKVWYDISIIPPGSGFCKSFEECHKITTRTGFNVPLLIAPTKFPDARGFRCKSVLCQHDGCPQAYHFPTDDTDKVYSCPSDEHFEVVYCP